MMNFAKLLLESYSLREQQDDVMQFLKSQAPQWNPSSGTPRPQSVSVKSPNNEKAKPVLVGVNQKGEVKIEAGPLGSQIVNANRGANPKLLAKLQAWYAGQDATTGNEPVVPEDPVLSRVSEESQERLNKLEELMPGTIDKFKEILKDSQGLVEDGLISEAELIQKIFGGKDRGSLAYNLLQEVEGGGVKFERTDSIGFALDDVDIKTLAGSINSMAQLAKAYNKSRTCEATDSDMQQVADNVRQAPGKSEFFFAAPYDDKRFGVSLSIAEGNPINMMANAYNSNVSGLCTDKVEDSANYTIPEKEIAARASDAPGNFSNIVKDASELVQVAGFYLATGQTDKAAGIVTDIISKFGAQAFNVLKMKSLVEKGEHILDEKYQELITTMDDLGINFKGDVKDAIKGPLRTYLINSMMFVNELKPDYAARVGGVAGKGDKSDVDYVMRERPSMALPEGSVTEVKFEDLDPALQRAIKASGDEIQDKYFLLGDSLKTYINEGPVKLGTASRLGGEASRLLEDGNAHGDFVWDQLGVSEADKAAGREILSQMATVQDAVTKLMDGKTKTANLSKQQLKTFVSKQVKEILEQAGITGEQKRIMNAALKEFDKNGSPKAVGLVERELHRLLLEKGIKRKSNGLIDKNKSRGSLVAFAALQASMGMDSTGKNPMSSIHILSTGNTYRENQNQMIAEPLKDLLDPDSRRDLSTGTSTWTVTDDGSTEFKAGKGKAEANSYINTRHLKKN